MSRKAKRRDILAEDIEDGCDDICDKLADELISCQTDLMTVDGNLSDLSAEIRQLKSEVLSANQRLCDADTSAPSVLFSSADSTQNRLLKEVNEKFARVCSLYRNLQVFSSTLDHQMEPEIEYVLEKHSGIICMARDL